MSRHSHNKQPVVQPTTLTWSGKITLTSLPFIVLGGPALVLHFSSTHNQAASVSRTVSKWRTLYHLDDAQAARIQQIELNFHSNGSPFSIKPARTRDDKHRHHEEISRLMSPEDGTRFMEVMEKSEGRH